jgi:hypothetical protein
MEVYIVLVSGLEGQLISGYGISAALNLCGSRLIISMFITDEH